MTIIILHIFDCWLRKMSNVTVTDIPLNRYKYNCSIARDLRGLGAIARSVAMSLGNQEAPRSILAFGTFFREDLVISTAILPLPLIQEEHLSVNGERMGAKYWLPASGRLAQEQCG